MSPELQGPCPRPSASASSHPCVVSCGASRVIIFPPPVLVTFPGPILSTCPQESIVGPPGAPPGASLGAETLNSAGFAPKFTSGPVLGAETLNSAGFAPKFSSRPILGADPRETGLGISGIPPGSVAGSLGGKTLISARFAPKSRARRCSYVFSSRWIHPCRRSGPGRNGNRNGNGSEENIPEPEKAGTGKEDQAEEENEILEV